MEGIWSTRSCDELTKSTLADAKVDTQPSILFGTFQEHSSALAKVDCSYETLDPDADSRCFWLASLKREKREDREMSRETWEKRCLGERQADKPGEEKHGEMRWLDLSHFSLSYNFTNCECPWISSTWGHGHGMSWYVMVNLIQPISRWLQLWALQAQKASWQVQSWCF